MDPYARIVTLERQLRAAEAKVDALREALRNLLKAYDSIMPGVKYIAVQDYAILNTAPIAARALVR